MAVKEDLELLTSVKLVIISHKAYLTCLLPRWLLSQRRKPTRKDATWLVDPGRLPTSSRSILNAFLLSSGPYVWFRFLRMYVGGSSCECGNPLEALASANALAIPRVQCLLYRTAVTVYPHLSCITLGIVKL